MDGEQYLRDLVQQRLATVRGPEPDATALYFFELKGAGDALVAAELLDTGTANDILEEWHRTLEAEGFQRREAVAFGFHGRAEVTSRRDRLRFDRSDEPDRVVRADPLDVHIMDVDGIHLIADGLIRFTRGFELRMAFTEGTSSDRVEMLKRMTQHHWEWRIRDSQGDAYEPMEGHGGLGAYTLRFRPAIPDDAQELSLTVSEDSHPVAQVSIPIPTHDA